VLLVVGDSNDASCSYGTGNAGADAASDAAASGDVAAPPADSGGGDAARESAASTDASVPGDATVAPDSVLTLDAANLKVLGDGCTGNATVSVNGGGVSASFSGLVVDLASGVAQLADRRACSLRIPAHVPRGYYLARLAQSFDYRARKSASGTLSAGTHVSLFSANPPVLTESWADGAVVAMTSATASRSDATARGSSDYAAWCDPQRSEDDVLALDLAVSATKDASSSDAFVAIDATAVRDGVELVFAPCE
jgi:hypothetical protein